MFVLMVIMWGCKSNTLHYTYVSVEGFTQGTTFSVIYRSADTVNYKNEIEQILAEIDSSLSTYNDSSVISKINTNLSSKADTHFIKVYKTAHQVSEATNGAFDITVGPLVDAYGFGKSDRIKVNEKTIDSLLQFVGYQKISLKNNRIYKKDFRTKVDMNAVAQGYTVEVLSEFLENKGIRNYLVEVGGEVKTLGKNREDEIWRIGIDKPVEGNNTPGENLKAIVQLQDRSLATSGNYRKFYIKDGVKYSHTIHPSTGHPVESSLLSVTVFADDCAKADALATAFMVMGLNKTREYVSNHKNISALFIYSDEEGDFQVDYSDDLEKYILREY